MDDQQIPPLGNDEEERKRLEEEEEARIGEWQPEGEWQTEGGALPEFTGLAKSDQRLISSITARLEMARRGAENLVIDSEEKAKEATASLAIVRKSWKQLKTRRLELTRPLDELKRAKALPFRELEDPLQALDQELEPKIARYHDEVKARRKALAEEQRQREIEALKAKEEEQLEQAEVNESALALEDAITTRKQRKELEAESLSVDSRVATRTIAGSSHRRRLWDYKVTDLKKVPRRLLATRNEEGHLESGHSLVMAIIKAGGREIAGIEIYQKSRVSIT